MLLLACIVGEEEFGSRKSF